jgi:hypothetical protein
MTPHDWNASQNGLQTSLWPKAGNPAILHGMNNYASFEENWWDGRAGFKSLRSLHFRPIVGYGRGQTNRPRF